MSVDCVLGRLLYRPGSESMPRRVFSRVEGQIERWTDTCLIEVEHYPRRSGGEACGLLFKVCKVTNDVSLLPAYSASHQSPVSATDSRYDEGTLLHIGGATRPREYVDHREQTTLSRWHSTCRPKSKS